MVLPIQLQNLKLQWLKLQTNAVANPWTVMIKLGNTAVTYRAMLRANRASHQT